MATRIAVIGDGLAGRVAAFELVERAGRLADPPSVMLCPGPERQLAAPLGARRQGFLCESAAGSFAADSDTTRTLLRRLGLADEIVTERPELRRWRVFRNGRTRAIPDHPIQLFRKDLLQAGTRWRVLVERFVRGAPEGVDESLEAFAVRRLGHAGAFLADVAAAWLSAGDARRLSVAACAAALYRYERDGGSLWRAWRERPEGPLELPLRATLGSGSTRLAESLDEALDGRIEHNARVEAVSDMGLRGFRLIFESGRPLDVDAVIVADHAWNSASLVRSMDPAMAYALDAIPHASTLRLHCGFRTDTLPPQRPCAGVIVPRGEGLRTVRVERGADRFANAAPAGSTLLTVELGGARQPADATLDDAEACNVAARELEVMLAIVAEPHFLHIERAPDAIPQPELGQLHRESEIRTRLERHPGFWVVGRSGLSNDLDELARAAAEVAESAVDFSVDRREAVAR